MTNKMLSLMTLLCLLGLQALLVTFPGPFNPVDMFLSTDTGIALMRAVLIVSAVAISFWPQFKNSELRTGLSVLGCGLIAFGAIGLYVFANNLYDFLKPLDFLFMAQVGVIYCISALSPLPTPVAKSQRTTPKTAPAAKKSSPQYVS